MVPVLREALIDIRHCTPSSAGKVEASVTTIQQRQARDACRSLRGAIRPRGVHVRLEPEARRSAEGARHEDYEATYDGTNEKKKQGEAFEI